MKPEVKFSVELTHINTTASQLNEDGSVKRPGHIDVGFEIIHSNGVTQFAPTTIPLNTKSGSMSDSEVLKIAARDIIPGQIALAYEYALAQLEETEEEKE